MTDDVGESAFRSWAAEQVAAAGDDMPVIRPPGQPGGHRTAFAAVAAVAVTVALIGVAIAQFGHRASPASVTGSCGNHFRPSKLQSLGEVGEIVDLDLIYTGHTPCAVSTAPPRVTLTDSRGEVYPLAAATGHTSDVTLHRGTALTITVTGFACGTLPKDDYVMHLYLGNARGLGIAVPAGVHGGSKVGKPNYCGADDTNGTTQLMQTGIGTADRYEFADRVKPDPQAGEGREWGLVQVTDAVRTVSIARPTAFTLQMSGGRFSADDSVNNMGGLYASTSDGFRMLQFGSTLAGYGIGPSGPVPIADFTAIGAIDALDGVVVTRQAAGVLDVHVGGYKMIFRDLGPAHFASPGN